MNKYDYLDFGGLTVEEKIQAKQQFAKNKYYFGPVMISTKDILRAEIQKKIMMEAPKFKVSKKK